MDKVEIIVLGGTWSSYPRDYQEAWSRDVSNSYASATFHLLLYVLDSTVCKQFSRVLTRKRPALRTYVTHGLRVRLSTSSLYRYIDEAVPYRVQLLSFWISTSADHSTSKARRRFVGPFSGAPLQVKPHLKACRDLQNYAFCLPNRWRFYAANTFSEEDARLAAEPYIASTRERKSESIVVYFFTIHEYIVFRQFSGCEISCKSREAL